MNGRAIPPSNRPFWRVVRVRSLATMPYMAVFPCLAISSLVLGLNLLADGLSERDERD